MLRLLRLLTLWLLALALPIQGAAAATAMGAQPHPAPHVMTMPDGTTMDAAAMPCHDHAVDKSGCGACCGPIAAEPALLLAVAPTALRWAPIARASRSTPAPRSSSPAAPTARPGSSPELIVAPAGVTLVPAPSCAGSIPGRGFHELHTSIARAALAAGALALLAGCAAPAIHDNVAAAHAEVTARGGPDFTWLATDAARAQARADVAQALGQPLTADAAVRIALANDPALQAQLFDRAAAAADATQSARLPNPVFAFERLAGGGATE